MNDRNFLEKLIQGLKQIHNVHDVILYEQINCYKFIDNKIVLILDSKDTQNQALGTKMEMEFNIFVCFKNIKGYSILYEFDKVLRDDINKVSKFNVYLGKTNRPRFDNKHKIWVRTLNAKFKY